MPGFAGSLQGRDSSGDWIGTDSGVGRGDLGLCTLFAVDLCCVVANDQGRNPEDAKHGQGEKR
jgi:hypothetical protein